MRGFLSPRAVLAHIRRHAIAYPALFLALSGTAYAADTIRSSDIVNGEVRGIDVRDDSLTGADIAESTLSMRDLGCKAGVVRGYARVKGSPDIPSAGYTNSLEHIDRVHSCVTTPGAFTSRGAYVRRASKGVYYVHFPGSTADTALVVANSENFDRPDNASSDNIVSVARMEGDVADPGSFRVEVRDADDDDDGSDPQDGWFNIVIP